MCISRSLETMLRKMGRTLRSTEEQMFRAAIR
jgi:hypothetical protein